MEGSTTNRMPTKGASSGQERAGPSAIGDCAFPSSKTLCRARPDLPRGCRDGLAMGCSNYVTGAHYFMDGGLMHNIGQGS